jgi:hypothetical protein
VEIAAPTVVFWFVLTFRGADHPVIFHYPVEDLAACEVEEKAFLRRPPHVIVLHGGSVRAGCEVTFASSEEH